MTTKPPFPRPTLGSIASNVKKNAAAVKATQRHQHGSDSIREADYKGHHIEIRTTYEIEVDGVPITGHLGVDNEGRVHYHPVPNASFASAVDLVKQLIDSFPDDFPAGGAAGSRARGGHMHMGHRRARTAPAGRRTGKATSRGGKATSRGK
jgi:hypothetical protein